MKKFRIFAVAALAALVCVSCGGNNKKAPAEPQMQTVTVDSDTKFEVKLAAENFAKTGTTYFVIDGVKGTEVTSGADGVVTVKSGVKSYRISPPAGLKVGNIYGKADGKAKDAVYVGGDKPYVVLADFARTKKVSISNKTVTDANSSVKPVVLKPVPVKETKQVPVETPAKK